MNGGSGSVGGGADTSGAAATAQKRIEMDGYQDVHGLAKGADGLWRGTAKRDSKTVEVTVDRAGRVAEQ
ncbi:hypothetical protein [Reyranella sp.]|uniref:hypothetical protein n=1 Tax=Reyranella sp. TaxID=1929291 RepID=UPI003D0C24D9